MLKTIKYIFYVLAIIVIASSVYIATLPSKFEHTYNVQFDKAPKQMIKNKLLKFEYWKDWAIKDTSQFKVLKSKDPLQSVLQSSLVNKQEFKLENEQINDSTIVQKLYTSKEPTIQTLTWKMGNYRTVDALTLNLKEELSFSDKLNELLKWKNGKREWLLNLENRLVFLEKQVTELASDYTLGKVKRTTFGATHYIYVTGSGNINHLAEQTQQHIISLEQFLAEQGKKAVGKPFTIYNTEITNSNVVFSTAIPIEKEMIINPGNPIRYNYKESTQVYSLKVNGNPRNMELLWKNFGQTKELTLTEMTSKKYVFYKILTDFDEISNKEQQLMWEIKTRNKEIQLDSLNNVKRIAKDSLFQSL